ncbi:hypothetical protein NPX13_g338 [Xylaria arbuscula]|uniref:Uncharacterized protein n=1 Tax=Xylaria arbuscula TaxID=114810 RepID=A0A9W8NP08_9PEZI|nr:hypothetical protein NPX13_g338 [Xylaria arbuscula]
MDFFSQHLRKATKSFIKSDPSSLPEILAIFIGGSRIYKQHMDPSIESKTETRDYDSVVVVPTKHDIYYLLNDPERRQMFTKLMGIAKEDKIYLRMPSPSSVLWAEFDAVGYTGYGENGDERSVKILNLIDIFCKETINLLSSKDRRVYNAVGPMGLRSLCVQTTTISNHLVIQHAQWVYSSSPREGDNNIYAAFGYMVDMLLTSAVVYGQEAYGGKVKQAIARRYFAKSKSYPTLDSFCRNSRFQPRYKDWLSRELASLYPEFKADISAPNVSSSGSGNGKWQVLFGATCSTKPVTSPGQVSFSAKTVSNETMSEFNDGRITRLYEDTSIFSLTSASYRAVTNQGVEILVKKTSSAKDEMHGAELAARYFPRIMKPRIAAKGELVYPLFRGISKSDLRLSYIHSEYEDQDMAQRLLHAEIVSAEDTLRAYRKSLSLVDGPPRSKLHQFFYDRLVDNSWMKLHYREGVKLRGVEQAISFDQLLMLRWRINGQGYGSLRDAFNYARDVLAPESPDLEACSVVFGLGRGNLMLSEAFKKKGGASEIHFTDLGASVFHPVMLDLATPLYADTMFESLFRNMLGDELHRGVRYSIAEGEIVVHLSRRVDVLTQSILRIKKHYLIEPICKEVQSLGRNLGDHVPLLAVGLFLCATVSRNFVNDPIAFVENFALGLSFLSARSFGDIDSCFQRVGFN